jgi:hypothetical protein
MSNAPYNASHLHFRYHASIPEDERTLRPAIDQGLFHHGELDATLSVINEVANQLDLDAPAWCRFMEEALRHELREMQNREEILCGLHELVAARRFQQHDGPQLHR